MFQARPAVSAGSWSDEKVPASEGKLVLNKMKTRDTISHELRENAPKLGLAVATNVTRLRSSNPNPVQADALVPDRNSRPKDRPTENLVDQQPLPSVMAWIAFHAYTWGMTHMRYFPSGFFNFAFAWRAKIPRD